jgi:hypothetical protein
MMRKLFFSLSIIVLVLSMRCMATTVSVLKVDDPIDPAYKCNVYQINSHGSYIYGWPSKYDQVFWPLASAEGVWHCANTGFTSFINDFQNIKPAEKRSIALYLRSNYKGSASREEELQLLEGVYALRNKDEEFKIRLLRVLARQYQELGFPDRANVYRKRALERIRESLNGKISEKQKLEYLYVAANYTRLFGDIESSDRYVTELSSATRRLKDKKLSEFAEYLSELVKETPRIKPGGILDPTPVP